ncbi:MAG: hypothetical protein COB83_10550 [Gammaproteobacteria bacterium]|nr:MAG: hypothetical protein COB83_10550 [Gammaproteobacteria bacterium]
MGVQLFFLISAFTVFMTFFIHKEKDKYPIRSFFIRRAIRIFPMYWFGMALYAFAYGYQNSRGWGDNPDAWHYISHFFLLNMTSPATQSTVVPGGWSISTEIMFYLLCPLFFILIKNLRDAVLFVVFSCVISITFKVIFSSYFFQEFLYSFMGESSPIIKGRFIYRTIISQLPLFSLGILIYYVQKIKNIEKVIKQYLNLFLFIFILMTLFYIFVSATDTFIAIILKTYVHIYFGFAFTFLFLFAFYSDAFSKVNTAILYLGKSSFSFYLIHFIVIDFSLRFLQTKTVYYESSSNVQFLLLFACSLPIAFLIALSLHLTLEKYTKTITKKCLILVN